MKKISKMLCFLLVLCLSMATLLPLTTSATAQPLPAHLLLPPTTTTGELSGTTVIIYSGNVRGNIGILPQMATLRSRYLSAGADVIMVDTGNFLQGTIYSTYDSGRTVIELIDRAGYDVVAIGSREFDFGTGIIGVETHGIIYADDSLAQLLNEASFYSVASNVVAGEEALYAFMPNATVTTARGRTVGFFGLTDPQTIGQVLESNLDGLSFQSAMQSAAYQANALAHNDIVIGLSNVGAPIFVRGAIIIDVPQGAGLTVGVMIIDNFTGNVMSHSIVDMSSVVRNTSVQQAVNTAMSAVHTEISTWATSEVTLAGTFEASRSGETNLGNLWTDALRWFALYGGIENFYDEDEIANGNTGIMVPAENVVAIWNGGNLRDFLNTGDVTMRDLRRVLPFPNRVAVMYLTGAQLTEMLEAATQGLPFTDATFASTAAFPHVAGIEFTVDTTIPFDAGAAYGNHWFRANSLRRVTINSINGNAFDADATYAIITSNAIFNGMDSNYISLERCEEFSTITSAFVVDVVWMYIMQELGGVIGTQYAAPQGRIKQFS